MLLQEAAIQMDPSRHSKAMTGKNAFEFEMVDPRSGIIRGTDILDIAIEDARNKKKTLVSTMDSVVSLMREVQCKEEAAEQAQEEAARSNLDVLAKVDELKQAQRWAKETNAMIHAREVYAQKAVLATGMKELQLRAVSMLDDGDRSLAYLDEMRRALEMRLTSALQTKEAADQEKLEKEVSAREALAYEESQMEKMVEESRRLKQEAVENSKLQEFLIDRGHVIDMLHGEISDKLQDVHLLKEKLDQAIMLSGLLFSSPTSSILASSSSCSTTSIFPCQPQPKMVESYETPKESAEQADFIEKISGFGLADSTDDHVQSANLEQIKIEESRPSVVFKENQHFSKTSNIDLGKQDGNKHGSFAADINNAHGVAGITEEGQALSSEDSLASTQTLPEGVVLRATIKSNDVGGNLRDMATKKVSKLVKKKRLAKRCKNVGGNLRDMAYEKVSKLLKKKRLAKRCKNLETIKSNDVGGNLRDMATEKVSKPLKKKRLVKRCKKLETIKGNDVGGNLRDMATEKVRKPLKKKRLVKRCKKLETIKSNDVGGNLRDVAIEKVSKLLKKKRLAKRCKKLETKSNDVGGNLRDMATEKVSKLHKKKKLAKKRNKLEKEQNENSH